MGCGCGSRSANLVTSSGATYTGPAPTGYTVTFPDGTTATYLTDLEAQRAARKAGGGRIVATRT